MAKTIEMESSGSATTVSGGIVAQGLRKQYGKRLVVQGVDLEIRPGEIVGLLGPNGAGKTTTFYMIVGLVRATEGAVSIDDRDITRKTINQRARMGIGYLPQESSVFARLTIWQNIEIVAELLPLKRSERKAKIAETLESMGLTHLSKQKAYTLSGGERRRLEIARALIMDPTYILMDEPFSGVDPISVADVQKIITDLKSKGISVLITDHNVRETLRIVDRAYLLYDGQILSHGTSEFLINDPDSRKFYLGDDFEM
ncbi:MAG: LPS export ABC transporter ATP-binding protein [Opitutales bacterium]|nr:LPS export ABC transporter ATP-binding protein [Opitutales bacterium]NRA25681.1 LPS export ABC transporter ATP-binding protein [Opitutales bacterium]